MAGRQLHRLTALRVAKDEAMARLYRFTSILGFFKRGHVDITMSNVGKLHRSPWPRPGCPHRTYARGRTRLRLQPHAHH